MTAPPGGGDPAAPATAAGPRPPARMRLGRWLTRHWAPKAPRLGRLIHRKVNRYFRRPETAVAFRTETVWGFAVEGHTLDIVQRFLYLYGIWEPNLSHFLRERLAPGDGFVDVGANIGYFTLLAAERVGPEGFVVAVEASPAVFPRLEAHLAMNRVENVRALAVAAAAEPGTVRFWHAPDANLGRSSILPGAGFRDAGTVPAARLADLLAPAEIARTRLVKIDVEGAERGVIEGLLPGLATARRDLEIVVEVGGNPDDPGDAATSGAAIRAALAPFGFHPYRLANDYDAHAYLSHRAPERPVRLRGPIDRPGDLVFSRIDAARL